jgi:hypothetical protein
VAWLVLPDVDQLQRAAQAWRGLECADPQRDRAFLSTFAVYLVKHFRAEEDRLDRAKTPDRAWHRAEHRRLVQHLHGVMGDVERGLEAAPAIHGLLEAWQAHQQRSALHTLATQVLADGRPSGRL